MKTYINTKFFLKKIIVSVCTIVLSLGLLTGCANPFAAGKDGIKVVLTTGFNEDEVFRIEDVSCSLSETLVYLINTQNEYESMLGAGIWGQDTEDNALYERVKSSCLARIAQIKTMGILAGQNGITLDKDETENASRAAAEYYASLNDSEIQAMGGITEDTIARLYREKALADKLYQYTIRDINPEVSDDEARTLTVEQIFMRTCKEDAEGSKIPMSDSEKRAVYMDMQKVASQIRAGASFESMVETYNEAEDGTISFGKGEVDTALEEAAFNLSTDEISGIIETENGYVILKCLTTFNREETEANKIRIAEQRKSEAFGQEYDEFASGLTRELNTQLWDSIDRCTDENVTTSIFFDTYTKYFSGE